MGGWSGQKNESLIVDHSGVVCLEIATLPDARDGRLVGRRIVTATEDRGLNVSFLPSCPYFSSYRQMLLPRYPFTSVLLLYLFSSPGIPLHQYYCCTCSHPPVSLYISIIVELVLIPRSPFTSVLLLYLFSSPGIPLHQYYC
jgi:hypothetical protein